MRLPSTLSWLRQTRLWLGISNTRYLNAHKEERRFFSKLVQKGDLVFDVGANVGLKTLVFQSLGAHVVAVEPNSIAMRTLRRRFKMTARIYFEQFAIGDNHGEILLKYSAGFTEAGSCLDNNGFSLYVPGEKFDAQEKVPLITLSDLVKKYGVPRFIKIDIEGYEPQALRGLNDRVNYISFEYHRVDLEKVAICIGEIEKKWDCLFNYSLRDTCCFSSPGWVSGEQLVKALVAQEDEYEWGDIYAQTCQPK